MPRNTPPYGTPDPANVRPCCDKVMRLEINYGSEVNDPRHDYMCMCKHGFAPKTDHPEMLKDIPWLCKQENDNNPDMFLVKTPYRRTIPNILPQLYFGYDDMQTRRNMVGQSPNSAGLMANPSMRIIKNCGYMNFGMDRPGYWNGQWRPGML